MTDRRKLQQAHELVAAADYEAAKYREQGKDGWDELKIGRELTRAVFLAVDVLHERLDAAAVLAPGWETGDVVAEVCPGCGKSGPLDVIWRARPARWCLDCGTLWRCGCTNIPARVSSPTKPRDGLPAAPSVCEQCRGYPANTIEALRASIRETSDRLVEVSSRATAPTLTCDCKLTASGSIDEPCNLHAEYIKWRMTLGDRELAQAKVDRGALCGELAATKGKLTQANMGLDEATAGRHAAEDELARLRAVFRADLLEATAKREAVEAELRSSQRVDMSVAAIHNLSTAAQACEGYRQRVLELEGQVAVLGRDTKFWHEEAIRLGEANRQSQATVAELSERLQETRTVTLSDETLERLEAMLVPVGDRR